MRSLDYAVWLYHRFTVSCQDVEGILLERGIGVTRESIRTQCVKLGEQVAQRLRQRAPDEIALQPQSP
ncbi:hypothetical protein ACMT4L_19160 [Deinococcus sp. A31D244]|uniref:hypothetical protein n=1 Tax=Deinococcus sp. A31D244 TaxID=3397675 RepID=UPI0039E090F3